MSSINRSGGTYTLAGHPVGRVGFGAMQLSGPGGRPAPDRADAIAVLRRAIELGVNDIDTAESYGHGLADELIRAALHTIRRISCSSASSALRRTSGAP